MDKLRVAGLEVSAVIGIHAWERNVRQRLSIDLEFETDAARTALSDDIADAHDYGAITREVVTFVERSGFRLIETLAQRIAMRLLDRFPLSRVKVVVHKPSAVTNARDTSIEIERARQR